MAQLSSLKNGQAETKLYCRFFSCTTSHNNNNNNNINNNKNVYLQHQPQKNCSDFKSHKKAKICLLKQVYFLKKQKNFLDLEALSISRASGSFQAYLGLLRLEAPPPATSFNGLISLPIITSTV